MKKNLFLLFFILLSIGTYAQTRQKLKGTINNNLPIEMEFVMVPYSDNLMNISGSYWYTKNPNGGSLNVYGTWNSDNNQVELTEKNNKEVITGYFKGKYLEDGLTIKGKWLTADKKKSFDFVLKHIQ
jgi:hypothetical protein